MALSSISNFPLETANPFRIMTINIFRIPQLKMFPSINPHLMNKKPFKKISSIEQAKMGLILRQKRQAAVYIYGPFLNIILFHDFSQIFRTILNRDQIKKNQPYSQLRTYFRAQSAPSQPVGYSFTFSSQIQSMKCKVSLQRDIIHQSIMSYLSIRLFELLALPKNDQYTEAKWSFLKLQKRPSSLFFDQNIKRLNIQPPMKETCFLHRSCQDCQRLQLKKSIYKLNFVDMYVLLKSAPFSNENHAVLSLVKYMILDTVGYYNQSLLLLPSIIRWEYVDNLQLLKTLNSSKIQERMKELVYYIVNKTVKTKGLSPLQNGKIAVSSGRTQEQIWMHLQGQQYQFGYQLIKYQKKYK